MTKFYTKEDGERIICTLCPHTCVLCNGQIGICRARKNVGGELLSLTYGKPIALQVDPVEKKPLYHFYPGSQTFSVGTAGCNLHCLNCQNADISQVTPGSIDSVEVSPQQIVEAAMRYGCHSISYTYNEPTVFYEFMFDTAKLAHEKGLKNIMVSNGYINEEPLKALMPYLDAANIDLKCFDDAIYRKMTTANLKPVLHTLEYLKNNAVWLEITNLVIPKWTDDFTMIEAMCDWLVENGFIDVPLHFSRFFPTYQMEDIPPTQVETMEQAYRIAQKKGLRYVYLGNLFTDKDNTYCPRCATRLILRNGYKVQLDEHFNGVCPKCGEKINGVW